MRVLTVILAHSAVAPAELAGSWTFEPVVLASVALAAVIYGRGAARLRRRPPRTIAFYAGLAVVLIALVSPVDAAGATLFSGHMIQHLLLMIVAAPLLAYARPGIVLFAGLRSPWRLPPRLHRLAHTVTNPVVVGILGAVALWAWHMPALYDLALENTAVHALEHASFLGASLLLWGVVFSSGTRRGVARPVALLLVFVNSVQGSALGAILLFASTTLYSAHQAGARLWNVSPLQDQQLAGGLMWVPPTLLYVVTMGWLLVRWFAEMDRPSEQLPLVPAGLRGPNVRSGEPV